MRQRFIIFWTFIVLNYGSNSVRAPQCDVNLPQCRQQLAQQLTGTPLEGLPTPPDPNEGKRAEKCEYPTLWLIPGKADDSCTRPGLSRIVNIDPSNVIIEPKIIRLPGCFTIEMQIEIKNNTATFPSYFSRAEYQWWNFQDFANLKCQNASSNGCGGFGNNCFYCDICNSLSDLERADVDGNKPQGDLVNQFRGIRCPERPGVYRLRRQFCFTNWRAFDEDGDCRLDFLQADGVRDYRAAWQTLKQIGFGTLIAKFRLAHNATREQLDKKRSKELEIDNVVEKELRAKRNEWDISPDQFATFRAWYLQYRKDLWHKTKYLPWLIYTNEVGCLKITFDVCDKEPNPVQVPWTLRSVYNGPTWQCN